MRKRIDELDMVKGIGIVYVFLRHLCELTGVGTYGPWVFAVFDSCTECVMFLFVFLSGYVFKSKGAVGTDIKNKVKQLLVPYLLYCSFFSLTYFIRYVLPGEMSVAVFLSHTLSNFLANPGFDFIRWTPVINPLRYAFVPYWYIAEIFGAFVVFILAYRLVGDKGAALKGCAAALLLALAGVGMYLDLRGILANTFVSGVSYFSVVPNLLGFAGLLMIGNIMQELKAFDLEAQATGFVSACLAVCLVIAVVQVTMYDHHYALQYAKWGQLGLKSVLIKSASALAMTYLLVGICYYLKMFRTVKQGLSFLGANTLDILLLHYGLGELLCMVFGFWQPIYDIPCYPAESFAWWHFYLVVGLTAALIGLYLAGKNRLKYLLCVGS